MNNEMGISTSELKRNKQWQENIPIRQRGATVIDDSDDKFFVQYQEIAWTGVSIIMRTITVIMNINLALSYYQNGKINCFILTTASIVIPTIVTTLIHINMYLQDRDLNKETYKVTWITFLGSFLFRYWDSLIYAIRCKKAEYRCDMESQKKFYKLKIREESDVAFIRIFDCFLEAAPQKILQITIVLSMPDKISPLQIAVICGYFGTMAWCLSDYHRCNRYAQIDKHKMETNGFVLQLCWHFCVSVSRILCLSLVASLFPIWTLFGCIMHSIFFGILTYLIDHPQFCAASFGKFMFCMILGIVYLFTFIMPKDGRTRNKYIIYYTMNSLENIACVALFILFSPQNMRSSTLFYPLCILSVAFYYIGILCMVLYYTRFHPKITAQSSSKMCLR
ncbi:XK-related protein 4 isoform X1 [Eupeodes corollae]|uniref:XK-related protein 4 isoform X1 n=1 Tax=Eupeodes corollae TaxID=290404 RepID=UPI002490196F|nr:XK-related protein 4 isoform X1 [Eupeodes corollae]